MRMIAVVVLLVALSGLAYGSLIEKLNWEIKNSAESFKTAVDTHLSKGAVENYSKETQKVIDSFKNTVDTTLNKDAVESYRKEALKVVDNLHKEGKSVLKSTVLAGDDIQKNGEKVLADGHKYVSDLLKNL